MFESESESSTSATSVTESGAHALLLELPTGRIIAVTPDAAALLELPNADGEFTVTLAECAGATQRAAISARLQKLAEIPSDCSDALKAPLVLEIGKAQPVSVEVDIRRLNPSSAPPAHSQALAVLRLCLPEKSEPGATGFYDQIMGDCGDGPLVVPFILQADGRLEPGEGTRDILGNAKVALSQVAFLLHDNSPHTDSTAEMVLQDPGQRHCLLLPPAPQAVIAKIHSRMQEHLGAVVSVDSAPYLARNLSQFHIKVEVNPFPLLPQALEEERAFFHFQPIIRLKDHSTERFEALIRLLTKDGQMLNPGQFIPPAEQHPHLIRQVDVYVLRKAAETLLEYPHLVLNINISGTSLGTPGFAAEALEVLRKSRLHEFYRLGIEITETAQIHNPEIAAENLKAMHSHGLHLFLDDFGSSFSSGCYLRDLPLDVVKVDGSFSKQLLQSLRCETIVRHMIECAHECGCTVVAEFLDSQLLVDKSRAMGFDFGQGFHLGKPLPAEELQDHPMLRRD